MNKRLVVGMVISLVTAGCATKHQEPMEASIGFLDGKYRICRENCPVPTPKEIDDSVPVSDQLAEIVRKSLDKRKDTIERELPPHHQALSNTNSIQQLQEYEIYFDFGKSIPNAEGEREFERFAQNIRNVGNTRIEIIGRTDSIGSMNYNKKLAMRRAENVAKKIEALKIGAEIRLSAKPACCHPRPYNRHHPSFKKERRATIRLHGGEQ